jgi:hypothetical protein
MEAMHRSALVGGSWADAEGGGEKSPRQATTRGAPQHGWLKPDQLSTVFLPMSDSSDQTDQLTASWM